MTTAYLTDTKDRIVFGETPALMQPVFGEKLPAPELGKHRFVAGRDGLYMEAQNPVIAVRQLIAKASVRLPYGGVDQCGIQLLNGKIPVAILGEALMKAHNACPNEWVGLVVWDINRHVYRLFEPAVLSGSCGHISYRNILPDGLELVVDLHSHGFFEAFFSETDDLSDLGGFYIAGVLSHRSATPSSVSRLVVNGHFLECPPLESFFANV
jgi:PRTRC genetic system protein A